MNADPIIDETIPAPAPAPTPPAWTRGYPPTLDLEAKTEGQTVFGFVSATTTVKACVPLDVDAELVDAGVAAFHGSIVALTRTPEERIARAIFPPPASTAIFTAGHFGSAWYQP